MTNKFKFFSLGFVLFFAACGDDDDTTASIDNPTTYAFERNGASTVSFDGQTTRIQMGEALIAALKNFDATEVELLEMYANETATGGDANPFDNADLNSSTKSIRSKVAASADFFAANTVESAAIKEDFASWITAQVVDIFPKENQLAEAGVAGQIADGTAVRYINGSGLEYNQAVNKSLIGALMVDQALNNYLSTAVLDEADNRTNNDEGVVAEGKNYTTMEHKWDEAYGYLYGTAANTANPNATIGADDSFLNKYIGRVENDADFTGIAAEIWNAFKLGRAAIVAKDYTVRDEQAAIIREKVSTVVAVRAVYYLQQGKINLSNGNMGSAFHDLSEGYGFIYSLQFTRQPNTNTPYFTKAEVDGFIAQLLDDSVNGFWGVNAETLDSISETIAAKFDFTVAQAAE